ncbi:MAG TPA: DUF6069 family protein, partial [Streptomyces sp.]|nr:DUF6069 family protein [Streptomyces sp.]
HRLPFRSRGTDEFRPVTPSESSKALIRKGRTEEPMMSETPAGGVNAPQTVTVHDPSRNRVRPLVATRPVWLVGVVATVVGAVVTELFALGAGGLGVPRKAAPMGAAGAQEIPTFGFAFGVLMYSVVGIVLAVALARWAKRPARTFVVTTVALTALSFVPPILAPHTAMSTQVVLCLSHLVAAAVIIPTLALRLKHVEDGAD